MLWPVAMSGHPDEILLLDFLEGALDGARADGVRRHVSGCRLCRRALADLSQAVDALERLPTAQIPHDHVGVRMREAPRTSRLLTRLAPVVVAAAALLVAAIMLRPGDTSHRADAPPTRVVWEGAISIPGGAPIARLRGDLAPLCPAVARRGDLVTVAVDRADVAAAAALVARYRDSRSRMRALVLASSGGAACETTRTPSVEARTP